MKIVKSLEGSGILLQELRETIHHEAKEQIEGFLGTLLYTLDEMSLRNMLTGRKTAEATAHLICSKIADKISSASKKSSEKLYLEK